MEITINAFSKPSIDAAKKQILAYRRKLGKKAKEIAEKLADIGLEYAEVYFTDAVYDMLIGDNGEELGSWPNEILVTEKLVKQDDSYGGGAVYQIEAFGEAIAFIEFGAGVFYNPGGDPYHDERPKGIVGIGEYGKGYGKNRAWYFEDETGLSHITRGTPEQPGLYLTAKEVKRWVEQVVKEVFSK